MPTNQTPTPRPDAATITEQVTRLEREVNGLRGRAYRGVTLRGEDFIDALDRIACLREALGASRAGAEDLNAAKREAWTECRRWWFSQGTVTPADVDRERDRRYPEARRRVVTLSNGERVEFDGKVRYRHLTWDSIAAFIQRDNEQGYVLTDAEITALYALAAAVQQEGA